MPPQFVRILPKRASTFTQGKILSSHVSKIEESHVIGKMGSCSLKCSLSPATLEDARVKNASFYHHRDPLLEPYGLPNFASTSRRFKDIEIESDGEAPCPNLPISSFFEDDATEDGEVADS